METRLRSARSRQLQRLSIGYHTRTSAGMLQTKVIRDVETVEQTVRQLSDIGLNTTGNLIDATVLTSIRAPAFLPFFLVMAPISAALIQTMPNPLSNRNQRFRSEMEQMAARVTEMTHLIPITRTHGLERNELPRMDTDFIQAREAGMELDITNAIVGSLSCVIYNIFNLLCLVIVTWVAYNKTISVTP